MMKISRCFLFVLVNMMMTLSCAGDRLPQARWTLIDNYAGDGYSHSRLTIVNQTAQPLGSDWELFFNQFSTKIRLDSLCPLDVELISTGYFRVRPNERYVAIAAGDSLSVDIFEHRVMQGVSFLPKGAHWVFGGNRLQPFAANMIIDPMEAPQTRAGGNAYPTAEKVYAFNQTVNAVGDALTAADYDIFPAPKQVSVNNNYTDLRQGVYIDVRRGLPAVHRRAANYISRAFEQRGIAVRQGAKVLIRLHISADGSLGKNPEAYTMRVEDGSISLVGNSNAGLLNAAKTLVAAVDHSKDYRLQNAVISDEPDFNYRGFMLDIARNFQPLDSIKRIVDLLAYYKINTLQFHFTDDEAWRVEIPALPELTAVGARRGCTLDESDFLAQVYAGNGDPNDLTQSANGYLTTAEMSELLAYAHERGIRVIPEIETPGHARAAIVAMKARKNQHPAERQYIIWDEKAASQLRSVQGYRGNVLNVAADDVYLFIDTVVATLQQIYRDAGLTLDVVHLGGDEVAMGVWEQSPDVQALMAREGLQNTHAVSEYYISRISKTLAQRGIRIEGWQEIGMNHSADFNSRLLPNVAGVNAWSTLGRHSEVTYRLANDGYPVILSNVTNFYMDMAYSWHQAEPGLHWGGKVDEFDAWSAVPYNIYASVRTLVDGTPVDVATAANGKTPLERPENIIGVQGQLWTETLTSGTYGESNAPRVQYMLLPKLFGLAERGWNARPEWAENLADTAAYLDARRQYNLKIGTRELPLMQRLGYNFRVAPPGIVIDLSGNLLINGAYPEMLLTYTLDGSEPTEQSPVWSAPVPLDDAQTSVIKARAFYLGKSSTTTLLFP